MAYDNKGKRPYNSNRGGNWNNKGGKGKPSPANVSKDFYNPYSFVPFSDVVYQLDETELAELDTIQDAPVKNGLSGKISVDFEAQTPFCVRSEEKGNARICDRYFVPGSSIKGMLRGVMEILSMANVRNGVVNNRYSMRDLRSSDYELKADDGTKLSGFLFKLNGKYYIQECACEKYHYDEIDQWREFFKDGKTVNDLKNAKSLKDKYDVFKSMYLQFEGEEQLCMFMLSGFMNNKRHEYLLDIPARFDNLIPINLQEWKDFIFIHEEENDNKSWEFWEKKLINYSGVSEIEKSQKPGIAPCFFRLSDDGKSVKDLGFAFLYRQPYPKRVHDMIPRSYPEDGLDMCDAVFGYVNGKNALKGRVQVGHSFISNAEVLGEQKFVLGSPKPTFYPFYLSQENHGRGLNTYCSDTVISGTKRYLVHAEAQASQPGTPNVDTSFYPLDKGTRFTTDIYFHNLHDYELGALLSSITFFNHTECSHSLGYSKPYGFGKMKVTGHRIEYDYGCSANEDTLYKVFLDKVCTRCKISRDEWLKMVVPLFVLADDSKTSAKPIRYPKMSKADGKEFEAIKNNKYSLSDFSPLKK